MSDDHQHRSTPWPCKGHPPPQLTVRAVCNATRPPEPTCKVLGLKALGLASSRSGKTSNSLTLGLNCLSLDSHNETWWLCCRQLLHVTLALHSQARWPLFMHLKHLPNLIYILLRSFVSLIRWQFSWAYLPKQKAQFALSCLVCKAFAVPPFKQFSSPIFDGLTA